MLSKQEKERYDRQLRLPEMGEQGQLALKKAKVLIVGAGGLGCPVAMYLAASGIGKITIMDGDEVALSNLPRQILFTQNEVGQNKAIVASKRIGEMNPEIFVQAIPQYLDKYFALNNFFNFDLVVDCTDNYGTRYLINDCCVHVKIPFVSAGIYKFEGQVGVYNVKKPDGQFTAGYRDIFPPENNIQNGAGCNEVGLISTLAGLLGLYQANEVIKYFISPNNCLMDKVLCINALSVTHKVFSFSAKSNIIDEEFILNSNYDIPACDSNDFWNEINELSVKEFTFVDVRENVELPKYQHEQLLSIPLSELDARMRDLANKTKIITLCKSGQRSLKAKHSIEKKYTSVKVLNYPYGIDHFFENLKLMLNG